MSRNSVYLSTGGQPYGFGGKERQRLGRAIDRDNYGRPIIASARDVGNIAVGYMSGKAISLP